MHSVAARTLAAITVIAALAAGAGACGSSAMTRVATPTDLAAPAGQATVVFLRPSTFGGSSETPIVTGDGTFLGTLTGRTKLVAWLPAGEHTFIAWAENVDLVKADLTAGKVYYVLVRMRMGVWKARTTLSRYAPDLAAWAKLEAWTKASVELTRKAGEQGAGPSADVIADKQRRAQMVWVNLDAAQRNPRTIRPEDGQ